MDKMYLDLQRDHMTYVRHIVLVYPTVVLAKHHFNDKQNSLHYSRKLTEETPNSRVYLRFNMIPFYGVAAVSPIVSQVAIDGVHSLQ